MTMLRLRQFSMVFQALLMSTWLASAATDIHIGVIGQFSGGYGVYVGNRWLEVEDYFRNWLSTVKSNTIGGTEWNFIWHHADGRTDAQTMSDIAYPFVMGTFDTQNQPDWDYTTRDRLPSGTGKGVEPAPHAIDILFLSYSSGLVPKALQALKDNNKRVPTYACGTNGLSAWQNADGSARWDFANNGGEVIATGELNSSVKWLNKQGAKTVVFVEEKGAGSWTQSFCDGARALSTKLGMKITADSELQMDDCGDRIYPEDAAAKAKMEACEVANQERFLDTYKSVIQRGKKHSADAIIFCAYPAYCHWFMSLLKKENINFGAYLGDCLSGVHYVVKDWNKYQAEEGKYTVDYWMYDTFSIEAESPLYDTTYNNVGLFKEAGEATAAKFSQELWDFRAGTGAQTAGGYQDALFLNTMTMFASDLERVQGDKTKLINFFGKKRMPITSHWGLLSATAGGWSEFHETQTTQKMPSYIHSGGVKLIAPNHVSNANGLWPVPYWTRRYCEDTCVECAKCDELQSQQILILVLVSAPFLLLSLIMLVLRAGRTFDITVAVTFAAMSAQQCVSLATDCMAVLTLFYEMEEEMISGSEAIWAYVVFIVVGIFETYCRLKVNVRGMYVVAGTQSTQVDRACIGMLDESAILVALITVDLPIMIIQIITAVNLSMSRALVTSMVMTAVSVGFGMASMDKLDYLTTIVQKGFAEDDKTERKSFSINQKKGFRRVTRTQLLMRVLNPCDFTMGVESRALGTVVPEEKYAEKVVDNSDKSN